MAKQEVSLNSLNIHKVPSLSLWKEQYNVVNGINENDLVIISPENLEDGVFYDLKDYDLYEKTTSSTISDLTGTTWTFNEELPNLLTGFQITNLTFTTNNESFSAVVFGSNSEAQIPYTFMRYGTQEVYQNNEDETYEWLNDNYRTISITGGQLATNSHFISWLSNNATSTSSGNVTTTRELWRKNITPSESGATYTKIGNILDLIQGPSIKSITIPATWSGSGPYYKTITSLITGYTITNKSKFDIQVDSTTINQLMEDGVQALYINNDNKVVKIYAIGAAPTQSITIQISTQETI